MRTTTCAGLGFVLCCILSASGCGGKSAAAKAKCPANVTANQTVPCSCAAGATGQQTCQADLTLTDCVCGGAAGTSGGAGSTGAQKDSGVATAGTTGGTSAGTGGAAGTGGGNMDDGGTANAGSGGKGGTSGAGTKPKADGSQLATCAMNMDCKDMRVCYTASGFFKVGYCTGSCNADMDCATLGKEYTCLKANVLAAGECRVQCMGADDKSCPADMTCQNTTAGGRTATWRCGYTAKAVGTGTGKIWQACAGDGDCSGELVCAGNGTVMGGTLGMPMSYQGYCTQPCMKDLDCSMDPSSGDIKTSCAAGECILNCAGSVQMPKKCPDGLSCVAVNRSGSFCMTPKK